MITLFQEDFHRLVINWQNSGILCYSEVRSIPGKEIPYALVKMNFVALSQWALGSSSSQLKFSNRLQDGKELMANLEKADI